MLVLCILVIGGSMCMVFDGMIVIGFGGGDDLV